MRVTDPQDAPDAFLTADGRVSSGCALGSCYGQQAQLCEGPDE